MFPGVFLFLRLFVCLFVCLVVWEKVQAKLEYLSNNLTSVSTLFSLVPNCEISTSISIRKRNFFHSLCLCLSHTCGYFTSGNRREVSTSTSKMIPPSQLNQFPDLPQRYCACVCLIILCLFHMWEHRKLILVLVLIAQVGTAFYLYISTYTLD